MIPIMDNDGRRGQEGRSQRIRGVGIPVPRKLTEAEAARLRRRGIYGTKGSPRLVWDTPRNGMPAVSYQWRARRYPWAEQLLRRAEDQHGQPADGAS